MDWLTGKLSCCDVPIEEVHPYINNPRVNDESVPAVAASIRAYGFQQPIVVDKYMTIIVGHTRYKAAKLLGLNVIPVVIADDLSPEQVRAYRLADNRTAEFATWDNEALSEELKKLTDEGYMFPYDFGFTETVNIDKELAEELQGNQDVVVDNPPVEKPNKGAVICPRCGYEFGGDAE